jgi:NAD(P)-dependent dehydrogenase (short-subunit alcohol dehydrogenase family)
MSGSEPYDTSKTALNHLIHELAIGLALLVRVNGIAPATVARVKRPSAISFPWMAA